ncbi:MULTISPECIES: prepilin peptidase [unclassified Adlercreutzia]|uniref:prepilin peptidase n=1 Tax=unclassified Adlercreutzia TaxID=2636013 RepID=UPI0013EBAF6A|nr:MULTISPECIES: prepilin peptidase [unclassified Adlercreutzia]
MIFTALIYLAFAALLVMAAVIDMRTLRIPNQLVLGLAGLWLVWRLGLGIGGVIVGTDFVTALIAPAPFRGVSLAGGIVGAVALGGALLLVTVVYEAVSKKRAMGAGDIKLLTMVGLFLGLERGVLCLLAACAAFLLSALVLPHTRWGEKNLAAAESGYPILREFPFGPAIALGSALALFVP